MHNGGNNSITGSTILGIFMIPYNFHISNKAVSCSPSVSALAGLYGSAIHHDEFHLVDSHIGIILMHAFTAMGVFLIRQFYMGIPNELLEAARLDGLSEYGISIRIMLPLFKPAIATMAITSLFLNGMIL